jgi:hypothetical protein
MNDRITDEIEQIDHRTSRSICDAVAERLQQNMRPETKLSPRLQQLMDELRRRDRSCIEAKRKRDFTDKMGCLCRPLR